MLSLLALLRFSLIKIKTQNQTAINCSARLICKAPKSALLYGLHWLPISSRSQYKIALICFHIVSGTAPPYLSELLHLSTLFLALFVQPRILGPSVFLGRAGPWGRDPFNISDL